MSNKQTMDYHMKFLKIESYKTGIIFSTFFNLINKGLVFLVSIIVAYYFGSQTKTDIYFYSYNAAILFAGFVSSLNSSVLIPESMRMRVQESDRNAMHFLNFFLYAYTAIILLFTILFFYNPVGGFQFISRFSRSDLSQNVQLLYLAVPLFLLVAVTALLTDILSSYKYFTIPMIVGIINGISAIVFIIGFHGYFNIASVFVGLLISYSINTLMLLYLMRSRLHWDFSFSARPVRRLVWKNIFFAQAGNVTSLLNAYTPLYLFSGMQAGLITTLNIAQQIVALPTALITNQFSAVSGIRFNELNARSSLEELNTLFVKTVLFLLFLVIPVSGIFFIYPKIIIHVFFPRYETGTPVFENAQLFLKFLAILIPVSAINTIVARVFMATHKVRDAFWYQTTMNILLVVTIYAGVEWFGVKGYIGATLFANILGIFILYLFFSKVLPFIDYGQVLRVYFKLLLINICITALLYFIDSRLPAGFPLILRLFSGCFAYAGMILILNHFFQLNRDAEQLIRGIFRQFFNIKSQ